jgi:hypothetical protein
MIGGTMNFKKISIIASTFLTLTNPSVVNADYTQNCYWSVKSFSIERSIESMSPKGCADFSGNDNPRSLDSYKHPDHLVMSCAKGYVAINKGAHGQTGSQSIFYTDFEFFKAEVHCLKQG